MCRMVSSSYSGRSWPMLIGRYPTILASRLKTSYPVAAAMALASIYIYIYIYVVWHITTMARGILLRPLASLVRSRTIDESKIRWFAAGEFWKSASCPFAGTVASCCQ